MEKYFINKRIRVIAEPMTAEEAVQKKLRINLEECEEKEGYLVTTNEPGLPIRDSWVPKSAFDKMYYQDNLIGRMQYDLQELRERHNNALQFLHSKGSDTLSKEYRCALKSQIDIMRIYGYILESKINMAKTKK